MSLVSAGLLLIIISCMFAAEVLLFLKEPEEAAAEIAAIFQMVCLQKQEQSVICLKYINIFNLQ